MQSLVFQTLVVAGESNQSVKVIAPEIGANASNIPNVKFNSQLAKEKVIATNKTTKIYIITNQGIYLNFFYDLMSVWSLISGHF